MLRVIRVSLEWIAVALLVALAAYCASAAEATGVRVIDGDTIEVENLDLGWSVALRDVTIRAADYDAWESSRRRRSVRVTDEEVVKGKAATEALRKYLEGKTLTVTPAGQDRYGRLLGVLQVDGTSVADWMKTNGHLRPD